MDADVARLLREERVVAAAELASRRGDAVTASSLFERACAWDRAAREALRAGDAPRALVLAVEGRDDETAGRAVPAVVAGPHAGERAALELERRGHFAWAARVHERAGRLRQAAGAWERAGEAVRAATLLERARDAVNAARTLEAALRREPERWELHVALGRLLLRYGKVEAAARTLQKVPEGASEYRAALTYLVQALGRLNLGQARAEAEAALRAAGGAVVDEVPEAAEGAARTRLFGRYEILREIASTATARVVECTDTVRGEHVAVKILAAANTRGAGRDALAHFEREVRVLAAVEHPNVVPLRDYIPEGPALVLAWMGGGTLETRIQSGALVPTRAVEIACAVLSALGEAHRLGILHRDIKPANVLFDDAGVTRLGDFGVAHLGDLTATATAGVFGTLAYMSPEQREGRPATVQSDLFGVGVLLFEMLTGELPSADRAGLRPSGVHRDLDPRHDAVVMEMFAGDPTQRPADAFAARRALTALAWPSALEPAAPRPAAAHPSSVRPVATRIAATPDGRTVDTWLRRDIERVPLQERTLARAGAFARAGHPALQTVLRVDRAQGEIWLAAPRGAAPDRALDAQEVARLGEALDALHAAGGVHGRIDRDHVRLDGDAPTLLFAPDCEPTATVDLDRLALMRLGAVV